MATATNFVMTFAGSNRTYSISGYTADTAAAVNTFNPSGKAVAGSVSYWRCPENVILTDFSIPTGTTQTSAMLTENGALKAGGFLDYVIHVSTNSNRPKLNIPFPNGTLIGAQTN